MKTLISTLAGAALFVALAAPVHAAVVPRPVEARHGSVHRYDERRPQHDGGGSILF